MMTMLKHADVFIKDKDGTNSRALATVIPGPGWARAWIGFPGHSCERVVFADRKRTAGKIERDKTGTGI